MHECENEKCPNNAVPNWEKVIVGLLVGAIIFTPNVFSVISQVSGELTANAAPVATLLFGLPLLLVLILSTFVVSRLAYSSILEAALTAAGLPAIMATMLNIKFP
ncbi:MAG: hypothetical protein JXQ99_21465 [Hyphomicrobiaceae bacterium]